MKKGFVHVSAGIATSVLLLFAAPVSVSAWYYLPAQAGDYYYYAPTYYPQQYYYADYSYLYYPQNYSYYYYPHTTSSYYPQYHTYPAYSYGNSSPSPYNWSYPTGDTDTFGYDICNWEGYGRGRCDFNPRQPVYDHWTGTWY